LRQIADYLKRAVCNPNKN